MRDAGGRTNPFSRLREKVAEVDDKLACRWDEGPAPHGKRSAKLNPPLIRALRTFSRRREKGILPNPLACFERSGRWRQPGPVRGKITGGAVIVSAPSLSHSSKPYSPRPRAF